MLGATTAAALFAFVFAGGTALRGGFGLFLLNILLFGKFENLFTLGLFLFLFQDLKMMKMHFGMGKPNTNGCFYELFSTNHVAFVAFDEELVTVFQLVQLSLLDLIDVVLDFSLAPLL